MKQSAIRKKVLVQHGLANKHGEFGPTNGGYVTRLKIQDSGFNMKARKRDKNDNSLPTVNGIQILYGSSGIINVKLQVVYSMLWKNGGWMARLSDGECLSPVVCFAQNGAVEMNHPIYVGDIIIIRKAKLIEYNSKMLPIMEEDTPYLLVMHYHKGQPIDNIHKLDHISENYMYLDSLANVLDDLVEFDNSYAEHHNMELGRFARNVQAGEEYRARGNVMFNLGNYKGAIQSYDLAIKLSPYDDRIHSNQAITRLHMKDYNTALGCSLAAVKYNPFNVKAYYRACQCFEIASRFSDLAILFGAYEFNCSTSDDMEKFRKYAIMFNSREEFPNDLISQKLRGRSESCSSSSNSKQWDQTMNAGGGGGKKKKKNQEQQSDASVNSSNNNKSEDNTKTKKKNNNATKGTTEKEGTVPSSDANNQSNGKKDKNKNNEETKNVKEETKNVKEETKNVKEETKNVKEETKNVKEETKNAKAETKNAKAETKNAKAETKNVKAGTKNIKEEEKAKNKEENEGKLASGYSEQKNAVYVSLVREARKFYRSSVFDKAVDFYRTAWDTGIVVNYSEEDQQTLRLAINLCRVLTCDINACVTAISDLTALLDDGTANALVIPLSPVHHVLSIAYHQTWHVNEVSEHALACFRHLKNERNRLPLRLPGFTDYFVQTGYNSLHNWYKNESWRTENVLKVIAKCRFTNCDHLYGTGYYKTIVKSTELYRGHVLLQCADDCNIYYHPNCWVLVKDNKQQEHSKSGASNKNKYSDKDFLDICCLTPDCSALIVSVIIYDETSNTKNYNTRDKSHNTNQLQSSTKQEKKKNKKLNSAPPNINKNKNNKNLKTKDDVDENNKTSQQGKSTGYNMTKNDTETMTDETVNNINKDINNTKNPTKKTNTNQKGISKPGGNLPLDELDFDKIKVLKPEPIDDNENVPVRNTRKKKKNQRLSNIEVLDIKLPEHSGILLGASDSSDDEDEKDYIIDIRKPFYMPDLLKDNPELLESLYIEKTNPIYEIEIDPDFPYVTEDGIETLLSFMNDFIAEVGPIHIDDPKLVTYMEENFPEDSAEFVRRRGGIRAFVQRSREFALIDDIVCVRGHVLDLQKTTRQRIVNQFANDANFRLSNKNGGSSRSTSITSGEASGFSGTVPGGKECVPEQNVKEKEVVTIDVDNSMASNSSAKDNKELVTIDSRGKVVYDIDATNYSNRWRLRNRNDCFDDEDISDMDNKRISQLDTFEVESANEISICCFDKSAVNVTPKKKSANRASTPRKKTSVDSTLNTSDVVVGTHSLFEQNFEEDHDGETLQDTDNSAHVIKELRQQVLELQESLSSSEKEVEKVTAKHIGLQDKLRQTRTKLTTDNSTLRKQLADAEETAQVNHRRAEQTKTQSNAEVKRVQAEKHKMQDETKALTSKLQALMLGTDKDKQTIEDLSDQLLQISTSQCRNEEQLSALRVSLSSAADRAKKAELGYVDVNCNVADDAINRYILLCVMEMKKIREMVPQSLNFTTPTTPELEAASLNLARHIEELKTCKNALKAKTNRFKTMLSAGRPLSSLPLNSLQSLPDTMICLASSGLLSLTRGGQLLMRCRTDYDELSNVSETSLASRVAELSIEDRNNLIPNNENCPEPVSHSNTTNVNSDHYVQKNVTPKNAANVTGDIHTARNITTFGADANEASLGNRKGEFSAHGDDSPPSTSRDSSVEHTNVDPRFSNIHQIFVGKLPPTFTSEQLGKVFEKFGDVYRAKVVKSTVQGAMNYGFVAFINPADRDACLERVKTVPIIYGNYVLNIQAHDYSFGKKAFETDGAVAAGSNHDSDSNTNAMDSNSNGAKPKFQATRTLPCSTGISSANVSNYAKLTQEILLEVEKEFSIEEIQAALTELRRQNKGTLTGLAKNTIIERVIQHLKQTNKRSNIAPWANVSPHVASTSSTKIKDLSEDECCICMTPMDKPKLLMQLDCNHHFHKKCINDWLQNKRDCPICRRYAVDKVDYPSLKTN